MLQRDAGDINNIGWPLFRSLCQQRFGLPLGTNLLVELARLPFRGTVTDYQEAFQERMAHGGYLSPEQQVQIFTGSLPDPICTDVELHAPADLQKAMCLARAYGRRTASIQAAATSKPQCFPPKTTSQSQPTILPNTTTPLSITPANVAPPHPFRRLTPTEMADRRRQGLCYNCDEPYVRGHKCPRLF